MRPGMAAARTGVSGRVGAGGAVAAGGGAWAERSAGGGGFGVPAGGVAGATCTSVSARAGAAPDFVDGTPDVRMAVRMARGRGNRAGRIVFRRDIELPALVLRAVRMVFKLTQQPQLKFPTRVPDELAEMGFDASGLREADEMRD